MPVDSATALRKRRHEGEDFEAQAPALKKSRVVHSPSRLHREQLSSLAPVLVANTTTNDVELPTVDWEQLFKNLDAVPLQGPGGFSDISGPVECNVFDFDVLRPAASTSESG